MYDFYNDTLKDLQDKFVRYNKLTKLTKDEISLLEAISKNNITYSPFEKAGIKQY